MGGGDSDSVVYLHGDLDFTIAEAQCLLNMNVFTQCVWCFLNIFDSCTPPVPPMKIGTRRRRKMVTCDPYVTVCLTGATVAWTRVKDNDVFGVELTDVASISAERIKSDELIDNWFSIIGPFGKPQNLTPQLGYISDLPLVMKTRKTINHTTARSQLLTI
ncbi:hypothetical protein L6452_36024 [Arctium lappa]|uniref:Uncharacterized protein n=1 Tax=Arctium lappa TaxID=4217 RepID=A0ACB8Y8R6_ARCLA|nr:hypothetical protein L6452_36024 [Arctium lappa]